MKWLMAHGISLVCFHAGFSYAFCRELLSIIVLFRMYHARTAYAAKVLSSYGHRAPLRLSLRVRKKT